MTEEDLEKRRIVENHISAYNSFDVDGMLSCVHKDIEFKNFAAGEVNAATKEIDEFRKLGVSYKVRVPVGQGKMGAFPNGTSLRVRSMVSVPVWYLSHFMPRRSKQLVIFGASFTATGFTASRSLPDRCIGHGVI